MFFILDFGGPGSGRQAKICSTEGLSTCKHTHIDRMSLASYCHWLISGGLTLQSHFHKNKRLAANVRELYQCSISPTATGQLGRQEGMPNCWKMAAGVEKDKADKCINYFINFIS